MKKTIGLLILLMIYIIAFFGGFGTFYLLPDSMNIFWRIFICNMLSTVIIWGFGVVLKTASIYDPYWSVQTPVIYLCLLFYFDNFNLGTILLLVMILLWAVRLTTNFIITFNDIRYIDWRYKELKEKTGKFYQIVNILGINMMPTILVYVASMPAFIYASKLNYSALDFIGYSIILIAILFELISDINIHKFKKVRESRSEIINVGLWKYSRHPNYLGEITFWYGVFFVLLLNDLSYWYYFFAPILINLLFVFISIPLAEKKLSTYKDGYDEYKKSTRMLIPIPVRSKEEL